MRTHIRNAGVIGVIAVSLLATACSSKKSGTAANNTPSNNAACPNGKVRLGVEPYEAPAKLTPAYKVLAAALEKGLGCPVELKIVESYAAEVLAMKNGQLELAEFGPLGFVFANINAKAEPIASFAKADGTLSSYTAGIWVPVGSKIQTLADLKGKTLALSSVGSTSGDALPRYALLTQGISQSQVKIKYAGGHPQSLLALVKGKVDAGEINTQQLASATEAKAIDPSKFRRIWESAPIPNDPITVWGDLKPEFKAKVADVLTHLTPADVSAIGRFLAVDPAGPMIPVTKATYQQLFDLAFKLHLTQKDV